MCFVHRIKETRRCYDGCQLNPCRFTTESSTPRTARLIMTGRTDYPQPYTVEFCQLYGEPLIDFCNAAKLLVGAILHLGRKQPKITGDLKFARHQALDAINLLRRPIASVLDFEENGSVKPHRVAPSLLASFADMFAQDLVYGRPTLQCICCGTPFVSSAYQARYCSTACRLREQKRRLRAQMKQAKALRAQGQSLRQIAASVGQPRVPAVDPCSIPPPGSAGSDSGHPLSART